MPGFSPDAMIDADHMFTYAESLVIDAIDAWDKFIDKAALAYSAARKKQQAVLDIVKKKKVENAKRDQFAENFVLSLLTVGIAGAVGGALARAAFKDTQKNAQDALKQIGQLFVNTPVKQLQDVLDPVKAVKGDIFAPVGPDSTEYFLLMKQNVDAQKAILHTALHRTQFGDRMPTMADAQNLARQIMAMPFVRNAPNADAMKDDELEKKARLALWIAWAYQRDIPYWYHPDGPAIYYTSPGYIAEGSDWIAVRQDLVGLGVPFHCVTNGPSLKLGMSRDEMFGFDAWNFCKWVASPAAAKLLFSLAVTSPEGVGMSADRMSKMILWPQGWINLGGK